MKLAATKLPFLDFYKRFHFPTQNLRPRISLPGLRFPSEGISLPSRRFLAGNLEMKGAGEEKGVGNLPLTMILWTDNSEHDSCSPSPLLLFPLKINMCQAGCATTCLCSLLSSDPGECCVPPPPHFQPPPCVSRASGEKQPAP